MIQAAIEQHSQAVQTYFADYPELYDEIAPYMKKADVTAPPEKVEILIDDLIRARITREAPIEIVYEMPDSFTTFEVQFDDEPVLFIINGEILINRVGSLVSKDNLQDIQLDNIQALFSHV